MQVLDDFLAQLRAEYAVVASRRRIARQPSSTLRLSQFDSSPDPVLALFAHTRHTTLMDAAYILNRHPDITQNPATRTIVHRMAQEHLIQRTEHFVRWGRKSTFLTFKKWLTQK